MSPGCYYLHSLEPSIPPLYGLPDSPLLFPGHAPCCFDSFSWTLGLSFYSSQRPSGVWGFHLLELLDCPLGPDSALWFCSLALAQQGPFSICDWSLGNPAPES